VKSLYYKLADIYWQNLQKSAEIYSREDELRGQRRSLAHSVARITQTVIHQNNLGLGVLADVRLRFLVAQNQTLRLFVLRTVRVSSCLGK
jgi:hypothetical protein